MSDFVSLGSLSSVSFAFRAVAVLHCIAHLIGASQLLSNRSLFEDTSVLCWQCVRLRYKFLAGSAFEQFRWCQPDQRTVAILLILLKLLLSLNVAACALFGVNLLGPLLALAVMNGLVAIRVPYGGNAAEEMANIVTVALCLGCVPGVAGAANLSMWFIAGQAILAYSTAGWLKVSRKGWYDGSYLTNLLSTASFSTRGTAQTMRRFPILAKTVGATVALGESAFGAVLLLPPKFSAYALVLGVIFHGLVAQVMGLNLFLWSFVACYPAIMYGSYQLHH